MYMSIPLNAILNSLEERFDFGYDEYFQWSESSKNNLTNDLVTFMLMFSGPDKMRVRRLCRGLKKTITHCESIEDFEQADILERLHKALNELDWKKTNG